MGNDTWLLVELFSEEIHSQVAMLAGLRRSGDANHLARSLLEDDQVPNANVVTWNGKGALDCGSSGGWSSSLRSLTRTRGAVVSTGGASTFKLDTGNRLSAQRALVNVGGMKNSVGDTANVLEVMVVVL